MSKNKSLSMKNLSSNKNMNISRIKKERLIRLRYHGKIIPVPYEEYLSLKTMNREKMKTLKDSLIQIIKTKKEIYIQQNSYDIESLKKISIERENEFRNIIFDLQKQIRREKNIYSQDIYNFYKYLISAIKNIFESANKEIEDRVKNINKHIDINLENCDYKQNKMLEKKIKENEEYFSYMRSVTYQMKKIMDNFDATNKKILEFQEINYNYNKKLLKEEIKNEYIIHLMKKFKIKINKTQKLLSEFKTNLNANTLPNQTNIPKFKTNFLSKYNNKNSPTNLKSISTQKQLKINNSSNKSNDLLLTIEAPSAKTRKRPFSSGQRLKTYDNKYNDSTKNTNYSNSKTLQSNFRVNSSKGRTNNSKANSHKNLLDIKNKNFKSNLSSKFFKTNQNSYFFSSETEENKKYTKSEFNSINLIKKEIKNLNNKKNEFMNKINENIPDNELYQSVVNIIEALRRDKSNLIVDGINNKYMKNYMKAIPIQDLEFRKKFLNILFNDKKVYESIRKVTKENYNQLFNKNLFGVNKEK